jgi:uncharacterized protein YjbI with pentapeptide repeats
MGGIAVFNQTFLRLGWLAWQREPKKHSWTVIVKGTYAMQHGAAATAVAADDQGSLDDDVHYDGDRAASCRYPSDFAPFKPSADVMVVGTCHPEGAPATTARVGFTLERLSKSLRVVGDRHWIAQGQGAVPSEPRPFRAQALCYERAFGGAGWAPNPLGKGHVDGAIGHRHIPLPNIERLDQPLTKLEDRPALAGLGPIDPRWPARMAKAGTYDDRWLAERWPWFPDDFDYGYFNAAPADQQVAGYLRGDEALVLKGLHATQAKYETRLPGTRPRCFVRRNQAVIEEVPLVLDTVWVDGDAERLVLVWRGVTQVASKHFEDLDRLLVVSEALGEERRPASHYHEEHHWKAAAVDEELAHDDAPDRDAPEEEEPLDAEEEARAEEEALAEARKLLADAKGPADLQARVAKATSIEAFLAILREHGPKPTQAEQRVVDEMFERARVEAKAKVAAEGVDPAVLDDPELEAEEAPSAGERLTRDEVVARHASGASLAGADLTGVDLSGLDLSSAELSDATLRGARLDGTVLAGASLARADLRGVTAAAARVDLAQANLHQARLDDAVLPGALLVAADLGGASLDRAQLAGAILVDATADAASLIGADLAAAELTGASFAGAVLRGARLGGVAASRCDLGAADLTEADLTAALLQGAELEGATLVRAKLRGAKAEAALFRGADLSDADLGEAALDGSNLAECVLDGARFERAGLSEAFLEGARGDSVSFAAARLERVRAAAVVFASGVFDGARADGSIWTGATLRGARFSKVTLERADFSDADLAGASFHLAVLKFAVLDRASLRQARLTKVNLFEGRLEGADLSQADCRGSNFFGCELLEAITTRARFEETNLGRTKLAPRAQP